MLFQKWLLGTPDTALPDWKAADFSADDRLNAFNLCLMKKALQQEIQKPHCRMTVTTTYGGYGVMGDPLESGSFTETFPVSAGDLFYETSEISSTLQMFDGIDYSYTISFSDFYEKGAT